MKTFDIKLNFSRKMAIFRPTQGPKFAIFDFGTFLQSGPTVQWCVLLVSDYVLIFEHVSADIS